MIKGLNVKYSIGLPLHSRTLPPSRIPCVTCGSKPFHIIAVVTWFAALFYLPAAVLSIHAQSEDSIKPPSASDNGAQTL